MEREFVQRNIAEPDPRRKLRGLRRAPRRRSVARAGPIQLVVRAAAASDPAAAAVWAQLQQERLTGMTAFANHLRRRWRTCAVASPPRMRETSSGSTTRSSCGTCSSTSGAGRPIATDAGSASSSSPRCSDADHRRFARQADGTAPRRGELPFEAQLVGLVRRHLHEPVAGQHRHRRHVVRPGVGDDQLDAARRRTVDERPDELARQPLPAPRSVRWRSRSRPRPPSADRSSRRSRPGPPPSRRSSCSNRPARDRRAAAPGTPRWPRGRSRCRSVASPRGR